jgi:hypothetical protein
VLARGIPCRLAILGREILLRDMRAGEVFDELADAAASDDPVQTLRYESSINIVSFLLMAGLKLTRMIIRIQAASVMPCRITRAVSTPVPYRQRAKREPGSAAAVPCLRGNLLTPNPGRTA